MVKIIFLKFKLNHYERHGNKLIQNLRFSHIMFFKFKILRLLIMGIIEMKCF